MQLVMRKMEGEEVGEWFIIEMQVHDMHCMCHTP